MQATREEFTAAIHPILVDLETVGPGLLAVALEPEPSEMQAVLSERDGSGTGVWLRGGLSVAEATVALADDYDEVFGEAAWAVTGNGTWPQCPRHPEGRPMTPDLVDGIACWVCGHACTIPIGRLRDLRYEPYSDLQTACVPRTTVPVMSTAPDTAAAVRRWRTVCIANTVGGAIVTVTAILFWPAWLAVAVGIFMTLAVADSWYLARRVAETGNTFIRPRRSPPAQ